MTIPTTHKQAVASETTSTALALSAPAELRKPRGFRRLVALIGTSFQWLCTIFVLVLLLLLSPLGANYGRWLIHVDPLAKADYIVVLGGGNERAVEAAQLYHEGWAPRIIVSISGQSVDRMAEVLKSFGVPPADIIFDERPLRTSDHPHTVAQVPGVQPASQRFIVVTSTYHTSRSRAVFLKAGYRNVILRSPRWRIGGDVAPPGENWGNRAHELTEKTYETLAWVSYKLHGWV